VSRLLLKKKIVWQLPGEELLGWSGIHTVCEESRCPNRAECSAQKSATFLIGGDLCTRKCRFCHISDGDPLPFSAFYQKEKETVLNALMQLHLEYVIITSVTRDDDPESLVSLFADLTRTIRGMGKEVELLIPDFNNRDSLLDDLASAQPHVIAHNVETVERLTPFIRSGAQYKKSMELLQYYATRHPKIVVKSGLMTGLGESMDEIYLTLKDMKNSGVQIVTVGQYLQPSAAEIRVKKYYSDNDFNEIKEMIKSLQFKASACHAYVRSSYKGAELYRQCQH